MQIKTIVVGLYNTNCYLLEKSNNYLIIDPGAESEKIKKEIKGKVSGILLTHRHFDHIGALDELKKFYNTKVYDKENLKEGPFSIFDFEFDVIYNPGHTEDSISFYFKEEKMLFCGDFIFKKEIGRCDLPTGDYQKMLESIEKIKKYPDDTIIYPGHDDITNLGYEKLYNPYF